MKITDTSTKNDIELKSIKKNPYTIEKTKKNYKNFFNFLHSFFSNFEQQMVEIFNKKLQESKIVMPK